MTHSGQNPEPTPTLTIPGADHAALLSDALFQVKKVIVGQDRLVERVMVCLLADGHCLIEGFPGLAKTLTVSTMAQAVGGDFTRLQFTPDLVPADLVGTRTWRPSQEDFAIEWGPLFANIVLADEINRAPAKVQSALLEAMAERHVTIAGQTRALPKPFLVLATQNPIESEGVYALPEAQRDRFLMHVMVKHPTYEEEVAIAHRMSGRTPQAEQVLTSEQLVDLQGVVRDVFVHHAVQDYAVRLVMVTREPARWGQDDLSRLIALGASPRGTLGLLSAARAMAVLRGRRYVVPQDVYDVAPEVLRHRITLTYDALAEGVHPEAVVDRLLRCVPAPSIAPEQAVHANAVTLPDGGDGMSAPLLSMAAPDAAARAQVLRRLELAIARRLDGRDTGDHASFAYGPGSERAGARPYTPGDDARLVDWNLTARSGQVWVRQTEADRELETWVVADRSASLDFGTAACEKRDVALGAAAAFGMLTLRGGNRFGVLIAGTGRLGHIPARRGRAAFLASLAAVHGTPRQAGPPGAGAGLSAALLRLPHVQPRRSQVVVVSDFLGDDGWASALSRVVRQHDVVAVHVTDPRELALPAVGVLAVVDSESGRQRYVQTSSPGLRARYASAAAERHREIRSRIDGSGAEYLHLSTDRDWLTDTVQFAAQRHRARRARPSDDVIARFGSAVAR